MMASVLVTSFVCLWRSCTILNWVQSSNFELLLCYVCVGYAGQGLPEDSVSRHRKLSEQHLMCDLVYTVWCTRFGLINGDMNMIHGTYSMKIIRSSTSLL